MSHWSPTNSVLIETYCQKPLLELLMKKLFRLIQSRHYLKNRKMSILVLLWANQIHIDANRVELWLSLTQPLQSYLSFLQKISIVLGFVHNKKRLNKRQITVTI